MRPTMGRSIKLLYRLLAAVVLAVTLPAGAADTIARRPVALDPAGAATLSGRLRGRETVDYLVPARAGQAIRVVFAPGNRSAYFNLLPPAGDTALFVGSTAGNRYEGVLPADGDYRVRVYLMRNAARRNEATRYTLKLQLAEAAKISKLSKVSMAGGFERTLELQGIRFTVTSANQGSINTVRVQPAGLEIDNSAMERTIDGIVTGAEVADLNADGSPEIYVYTTSAGSGSYGSLVAFSANRRKSLSDIVLPPLENVPAAQGYQGHDEFAVLEGVLGRRFPVYRAGDSNARPSGPMRQLQYRLRAGEAGWHLAIDRVVEFPLP